SLHISCLHLSLATPVLTIFVFTYCFHAYRDPPVLHSFPTRRSSDLAARRDPAAGELGRRDPHGGARARDPRRDPVRGGAGEHRRSEEHTSELQSLRQLVCRLLLEKKKQPISSQ